MENHFNNVYIIILAGGEGVRFAPLSTPDKPKQFLNMLDSERSMIQQTFDRVKGWVAPQHIYISTHKRYVSLVADQLPEIPKKNIIGEPLKKNTAPAIGLVSRLICQRDDDAILIFLPSDHYVAYPEKMYHIFEEALDLARLHDVLIMFGVTPEWVSTEFGYIRFNPHKRIQNSCQVEKFVEKPDLKTAETYLKERCYLWNCGIFIWRASVILNAISKYLPKMSRLLDSLDTGKDDLPDPQWINDFFSQTQGISIDYGVMEKSHHTVVLPFDVGWSDVGTWEGLKNTGRRFNLKIPLDVEAYLK